MASGMSLSLGVFSALPVHRLPSFVTIHSFLRSFRSLLIRSPRPTLIPTFKSQIIIETIKETIRIFVSLCCVGLPFLLLFLPLFFVVTSSTALLSMSSLAQHHY
jgi:hypothetical protein